MRNFFFRRNWRERILLLAVLLVGALIWFFAVIGRVRDVRERLGIQKSALEAQAVWLDNASTIEAQLQSRLAEVPQGRSLNANKFIGQLDTVLKRQHMTSYRLDPPTSERRPPVVIHTASLSLDKIELATLASFSDELRTALPLVNIEQLVITPDRRNPAQLDVRLKLSGLELLP